MFNRISKKEIEMMREYIAECSGSYPKCDMEVILTPWEDAKFTLSEMFGGEKLILSKQVEFKKGKEELYDDMKSKLCHHSFFDTFRKFCYSRQQDWKNLSYEERTNWDRLLNAFITYSWWVLNSYGDMNDPYFSEGEAQEWYNFSIPLPNKKSPYKVKLGDRPTRFIGKIATAYGMGKEWEEFRIYHSQLLNETTAKGELCLSIHPLDYMTMSDNDCDWSSCMSWKEEGDYRQGTVEMMNSPMVVVGYLKSSKDMKFPAGWSNKKWRQLFIVNKDFIIPIKGYPYHSETLENECMSWIRDLCKENLGWEYHDDKIGLKNNYQEIEYHNGVYRFEIDADCMYNDLYNTHNSYVGINTEPMDYAFNYSGKNECMVCGKTDCFFEDEVTNEIACDNCSNRHYCDNCGDRIYGDSYWVGEDRVCEDCWNDYCTPCDCCGEVGANYRDDMNEICIEAPKGCQCCWDSWKYICGDCYEKHFKFMEKYKREDKFGIVFKFKNLDDEFFKTIFGRTKKQFGYEEFGIKIED